MACPRPEASSAPNAPEGAGVIAVSSSQLYRLAVDQDALGAHLLGLVAVRVALDRRGRAGLQPLLRQPAILHARWRRGRPGPGLAWRGSFSLGVEADMAMRVLVAGLDDLAGELEHFAGVVFAPAVMR